MFRMPTLRGWLPILMLLPACSSAPRAEFDLETRRATLTSEPSRATVTQLRPLHQPSRKLGRTPIEGRTVPILTDIGFRDMPYREAQELAEHAGSLVVRVEKEGYEPRTLTLKAPPNEPIEREITLQPARED